jgi:hypothetical protein
MSMFLTYKCRRCGESFQGVEVRHESELLSSIAINQPAPAVGVFPCKEGGIGIYDLQGLIEIEVGEGAVTPSAVEQRPVAEVAVVHDAPPTRNIDPEPDGGVIQARNFIGRRNLRPEPTRRTGDTITPTLPGLPKTNLDSLTTDISAVPPRPKASLIDLE